MEQMLKRRSRNNSFTNRDKFIAYSYGSTYSLSLMNHYRQLDYTKTIIPNNGANAKMRIIDEKPSQQKIVVDPKEL